MCVFTGLTARRTGFEITNDNDVLDPNMMLGRVGREATLGSAEASQTEMSMASVSRHRLTGQGSSLTHSLANNLYSILTLLHATPVCSSYPSMNYLHPSISSSVVDVFITKRRLALHPFSLTTIVLTFCRYNSLLTPLETTTQLHPLDICI